MNIKVGQAGEVRSDTDESETESLFSHIEVEELLVEVEDKEKGKQKEIVTEQDERLQEETENTENIGMESFEDPPDHVAGSENINESAHTSTPLPESPIPNLANITSLLQSSFSRLTDTLSTNLALGDFLDAQKRSTAIVNIGMEVNSIIREVGESIRTEAEIIQRDFSTRMSDGTNAAADGQEEKNDAAGGEESNERQEEDISIPIPGAFDFDTPVDPILSQFDSHATGYRE